MMKRFEAIQGFDKWHHSTAEPIYQDKGPSISIKLTADLDSNG